VARDCRGREEAVGRNPVVERGIRGLERCQVREVVRVRHVAIKRGLRGRIACVQTAGDPVLRRQVILADIHGDTVRIHPVVRDLDRGVRHHLALHRQPHQVLTEAPRILPERGEVVVSDQGRTLMVAYSGGTLTGPFGTNGARWDEYVESQQRIAKAAADAGATVILSNHSEYDNAYTKARLIAAKREVGENHPFIVGADSV
jgi:hypothetical protein